MLTKKQNVLETIRGGNPDRFVNQFEAFVLIKESPYFCNSPYPAPGAGPAVNSWGVTQVWPAGHPGAFPVHTADKIVCPDITKWRDYVKAPAVKAPESEWAPFVEMVDKIDRNEYFVTPMVFPGIFEMTHYLQEITNAMMNFYEEPEATHELIDYITEWELCYAEELIKHYHPDALFHHDDWGTQRSTFMSKEMFDEFLTPAYKKLYGFYKENGVEVIVHHSDCYAATLVPSMIEMGIDIWQGVMKANDIPSLIDKYGKQITFMGGINSADVDFPGWTREDVAREVERACKECGKLYFIPSASQGDAFASFPGVYDTLTEEIDKQSKLLF